MIGLLSFLLAVLVLLFRSRSCLLAKKRNAPYEVIVLRRKVQWSYPAEQWRSLVFRTARSLVPIDLVLVGRDQA